MAYFNNNNDKWEDVNKKMKTKEEIIEIYGQVWNKKQLQEDFKVLGFMAPFVAVIRKSDNLKGSLEFQHFPRFYFNFIETSKLAKLEKKVITKQKQILLKAKIEKLDRSYEKMDKKTATIQELCEKVDQLYFYTKELIPKNVEHNLGFRKEKLKQEIENKIMSL